MTKNTPRHVVLFLYPVPRHLHLSFPLRALCMRNASSTSAQCCLVCTSCESRDSSWCSWSSVRANAITATQCPLNNSDKVIFVWPVTRAVLQASTWKHTDCGRHGRCTSAHSLIQQSDIERCVPARTFRALCFTSHQPRGRHEGLRGFTEEHLTSRHAEERMSAK